MMLMHVPLGLTRQKPTEQYNRIKNGIFKEMKSTTTTKTEKKKKSFVDDLKTGREKNVK